jgi:hypothetical protein
MHGLKTTSAVQKKLGRVYVEGIKSSMKSEVCFRSLSLDATRQQAEILPRPPFFNAAAVDERSAEVATRTRTKN